ncbi:RNA/RNP complex-1-interacting phosphatase isoform X2 [Anarrhichthys ocellatus]|uniref:RNA/RNP complex-1-interacting phosphatase isoform X2 n=1 Tax=Anarrhichthys ocellatus TaxID=433405 RepID=UPI0012EDA24F|nr:RNA/RNP complex-1-interacting phosphatase isoform X2 [Anarrhichthys ocellatus]
MDVASVTEMLILVNRWLDYSAVGKRLDGTRFIAFKVPLKQSLNRQLPSSDVFGPWELLDALNTEKQELGLIVDLTFTTRYYTLQDIPESLLVLKIFTAGHEVPSDDTILSFKRAVCRFLRDNAENDKLIGVHCTHGLNRTGYLICRYLIDVDGMDPKEAVELFNSSRGHDVERQNYLDDLQSGPKRSNEGMEEAEQEPMRGLASHRPSFTPSDSDSREERQSHFKESRNDRPFPPRGTNQRSHHHHTGPPKGAPHPPYQWTPSNAESQWRSTPRSEDRSSRYPPPDDWRSRCAPPEDSRSRYAPPEDRSSRYPPPEDWRSRCAPPEDNKSRYTVPEDWRSRYAPPEDSRSRYAPPENRRSRYAPPEERRSTYAPPEDRRSRFAPPEERRSRYPPPQDRRSRCAPPEEDRRRGPPPLPRYSARWTNESIG